MQGSALGGSEWGAVCAPVDQGRFRRSPPALPPRIRLRKNWVYPRQSSLSVQCNEEWWLVVQWCWRYWFSELSGRAI
eukprot:scaffold8743_cov174-Isochrysis_galbana.AAC.1